MKNEFEQLMSMLMEFLANHDRTYEITVGEVFDLADKISSMYREMRKQKV